MYNLKDLDISTFLNEDPTFQKIIQGFYGLNYTEFIVFSSLYQLGRGNASDVMQITNNGWPRNKITTALKKLYELNLTKRERISTESGGYTFLYRPKPPDLVREEIISSIQEWFELTKLELEELFKHLLNVDTKAYQRNKEKISSELVEPESKTNELSNEGLKTKIDDIRKYWFEK